MKIKYGNGSFTADDLVRHLELSGVSQWVFREVIRFREVARKARELGLAATDEEVQQAADEFRTAHGLYSADAMMAFLASAGMSVEEFESHCEVAVWFPKVVDSIATEQRINEYFAENRADLDRVRISRIIVSGESLCREILLQVQEEGEDFHRLARKHSEEEGTRYAGGHIGWVYRRAFSPEIAARIFSASAGEVVGPFPQDGRHCVALVEEVVRADNKSEAVRAVIRTRLMTQWTEEFVRDGISVQAE